MKLKKLLSFLITGTMAVSCLSLLASAEESIIPNKSVKSNENVRVLYDAPLTGAEFGVFELGKSIEGAKLRFTYVSDAEKGAGVIGIAGRAADDEWTWLQ
ncbi:MAG: hypothetical protein K2F81_07775, partial [Ruminococcus sp.]|nr:hypothetical protein [Ruminococcus sp.]